MASPDPVEVVVKVTVEALRELKELDAQLKKLESRDIDIDLDIDAAGEIAKAKAQLAALEESVGSRLHVVSNLEELLLKKQLLATNETSRLRFVVDEYGSGAFFPGGRLPDTAGPPGPPVDLNELLGFDRGRYTRPTVTLSGLRLGGEVADAVKNALAAEGDFGSPAFRLPDLLDDAETSLARFSKRLERVGEEIVQRDRIRGDLLRYITTGRYPGIPGASVDRGQERRSILESALSGPAAALTGGLLASTGAGLGGLVADSDEFGNLAEMLDKISFNDPERGLSAFGRLLRRLRPTMKVWYGLLAAAIPILITLGAAAIGAAGALLALAAAFTAIGVVGILGFGPSVNRSLDAFTRRLSRTKDSLQDTFRPVGLLFAPIIDDLLRIVEVEAGDLTEPLRGLVVFADVFRAGVSGLISWLGQLFTAITDLAGPIEQLSTRLGIAVGQAIIDLLRWAVMEVYENQEAFAALVEVFLDFIIILYNVSKAISFVLATFEPVVEVLAGLSNLLDNKLVVSFLTLIVLLGTINFLMVKLAAAFALVNGRILALAIGYAITGVQALIGWIVNLTASIYAAYGAMAALLALTGAGLILLGTSVLVYNEVQDNLSGPPSGDGFAPYGGSRYGGAPAVGGPNVNITINGNVEKSEMDRLLDRFPAEWRTEMQQYQNTNRNPE